MEDVFLRLPFAGDYPISLGFGSSPSDSTLGQKFQEWGIAGHHGIDFALPVGTPILASDFGTVLQVGDDGDWGISIRLSHSWGESIFGHLSQALVATGQAVAKGELLGYSGQTGAAVGPHLHFGIRPESYDLNNGYLGYVDPTPFFSQSQEAIGSPVTQAAEEGGVAPVGLGEGSGDRLRRLRNRALEVRREKREEILSEIVELARENPVTSGMLQKTFRISRQTATNYLAALVGEGRLVRSGKNRGARYNAPKS